MKIAIIIRGPGYINFFKKIGDFLKKRDIKVIYVLEDKYEIYKENYIKEFKKETVYYLTDFRNFPYKKNDCKWIALYSTYDRITSFRYNVTKKDIEDMFFASYYMWDFIFNKEEIDGVLYEDCSNVISYVAYLKCIEYGKKYIAIVQSRLPGRLHIFSDLHGTKDVSYLFEEYINSNDVNVDDKILQIYYKMKANDVKLDYMKDNPTNISYSIIKHYMRKLNLIWIYLKYYFIEYNQIKKSYTVKNPFMNSLKLLERNIKRKLKYNFLRLVSYFEDPDFNEKFLIYPLHFHPEASTSLHAWPYIDELSIIKNIAFSLPYGYKLYVKPHPNGVGYEDLRFYQEIKKIPQVKLIPHYINIKELIKKSYGVVTLTSTVGFEALMLNKPVFLLGNVFYEVHPFCIKIDNIKLLYQYLRDGLSRDHKEIDFEYYNKILLKAYYNCTFPAKYDTSKNQSDENIENICAQIINILS
jgi:hypothetical protein